MIAKISVIRKIPTGDAGCSNLSSIASNGNKLWACKVSSDNTEAIIYHCPDISSASPILEPYPIVANVLGHASGMTCNSNYLLIGCKQPPGSKDKYICRIPIKAIPTGKYGSYKVLTNSLNVKPGAIASYKPYQVIIRNSQESTVMEDGFDEFWILKFTVDSSDKVTAVTHTDTFYTYMPGYRDIEEYQDIYYDKTKKLLFVIYNVNFSRTKNQILIYDLSVADGQHSGRTCYKKDEAVTVDFSEDAQYSKYEVESATLDANRYLILACNIEGKGVSDAIVRVTNRKW